MARHCAVVKGSRTKDYPDHLSLSLWALCVAPFDFHRCMYDDQGRRLHGLDEMARIIDTHDQNLTLYCANDGNLIAVATIGTATVIDDLDTTVKFSEAWYKNAFLHRMLELVRDYLQHPIWSVKKLQTSPSIKIPDSHFKHIVDKANWIAGSFESYCKHYAIEHKINTHFAMMNTNIMVVCWKEWDFKN